jgi:hypothetical protein
LSTSGTKKQGAFKMNTRKFAVVAMGLALAIGGAGAASAQGFDSAHPRRAEVNARLAHQDRRIDVARREGVISPAKAHRLHVADRRIRMHERRFAAHHGGRISVAMQHRLNRQENRVSRRIG